LPLEQAGGVTVGPVQEGELDEQVGPDVPDVRYRRAQPALRLLAAALSDGIDGAPGAEARLETAKP